MPSVRPEEHSSRNSSKCKTTGAASKLTASSRPPTVPLHPACPLLSINGNTLISDEEKILEHWAEHFGTVLNRPFNIYEEAIELLTTMWSLEKLLQELKDVSIIHYRKGSCNSCNKHRSISLLSIVGKILSLFNRHLQRVLLPKSQCGLFAGGSTLDIFFTACQLQEKCQEKNIMSKIMAKFDAQRSSRDASSNARVQGDGEYPSLFPSPT